MSPGGGEVDTFSVIMLDHLPNAFTHGLAHARGLSDRRLRELSAAGTLERLGRGLYRKADAPPVDLDRVEIALRAPDATLCLLSALSHHDLTDAVPEVIDVALPRAQRVPRTSLPVRWHRFHDATFGVGRERIEVDDGLWLGVYGPERCVIDALRLRHQEGEDVAMEALRRYLRRPRATAARLIDTAASFPSAMPALLHALRVLL